MICVCVVCCLLLSSCYDRLLLFDVCCRVVVYCCLIVDWCFGVCFLWFVVWCFVCCVLFVAC